MAKVKYIKTKNNVIIVFPHFKQHSDFRHLDPVSAGFISFGVGQDRNPDCTCYGESVSLNLKSSEEDSSLAKRQILGWDFY